MQFGHGSVRAVQAGYGYLWWVVPGPADGRPPRTACRDWFTAAGNGGRYVTVFPDLNVWSSRSSRTSCKGQPPVPLYAQPNAYSDLLATLVAELHDT